MNNLFPSLPFIAAPPERMQSYKDEDGMIAYTKFFFYLMMDATIFNADAIALTLIRAALTALASPFTLHSIKSYYG